MGPEVKLTYFNLRARGEPSRLLLAYGGIKYEDERIAPPWDADSTWSTLKPTTPFGQLPVLKWDGVELSIRRLCSFHCQRGWPGRKNFDGTGPSRRDRRRHPGPHQRLGQALLRQG